MLSKALSNLIIKNWPAGSTPFSPRDSQGYGTDDNLGEDEGDEVQRLKLELELAMLKSQKGLRAKQVEDWQRMTIMGHGRYGYYVSFPLFFVFLFSFVFLGS